MPDDVGYTGHKFDTDTGLIYAQARYHDPVVGRFYSKDPIGSKDQFNLYAYVGNNPFNMIDPTGMYGRGSGWEGKDKEWERFNKAQQNAATAMNKAAARLLTKEEKLEKAGETGGNILREKSRYLAAGAAALKSDGSDGKLAHGYSKEDYAKLPNSTPFGAASAPVAGSIMNVNLGSELWTTNLNAEGQQRWAVGHESLHR